VLVASRSKVLALIFSAGLHCRSGRNYFDLRLPISPDVWALVKTGGNPITPRRKPTVRLRGATETGNERPQSSLFLSRWGNWRFFLTGARNKITSRTWR